MSEMAEESKVKVHGMWASPYSKMVELALRVKSIPYEYIEEDLRKKSHLLLQYNSVHKKVPVLVHNGKPIAESFIILEYIDEAWPNNPRLLPEDPYERAQVRFWVSFIQQPVKKIQKKNRKLVKFYKITNRNMLSDISNMELASLYLCSYLGLWLKLSQATGKNKERQLRKSLRK